jgi:NAD(P)-dependent dehydrogenase (short-subunit alcohol dehydrogenase family)
MGDGLLAGKVAVVSGVGPGLGREIVQAAVARPSW